MGGIDTYTAPYAPTASFPCSRAYPMFSVVFQWHASGSTAGAHGSTAYAVVPLGTTVALPLEVSPSVQLSVASLLFTVVAR
jgi:hypothetical protein